MKKKGFTLAEVLIAVGIIGVMSAIMASAFNQAKPDKTKMMYLKAYDSLSEAVSIMANDSSLFSTSWSYGQNDSDSIDISLTPLLDTTQPTNPYYYDSSRFSIQGFAKFGRMLALILKVAPNNNAINTNSSNVTTFTTGPSRMEWTVGPMDMNPQSLGAGSTQVRASIPITLRIDGDTRDPFQFCVQPDGAIRVMDNRGATYLANRRNIRSRNDSSASGNSTACNANNGTLFYIYNNEVHDEQQQP